jgi:hypothetical protein
MCTDAYREALKRALASTVSSAPALARETPALAKDAPDGDKPEAAADESPDQPRRPQPASA